MPHSPRVVLLNPGPVNVSDAVRAAMAGPDWCHREEEAYDLTDEVRALILRALQLDASSHSAVVLAGSGTAAVEAMISSCVPAGKKLLVVTNGVYGERMAAMARAHGIGAVTVGSGWFDVPQPADVDLALRQNPDVGAVALVHHETTTGLLNPVQAICEVARQHGVAVLLDTVSGLAGETLDLASWNVDAAACTANKCFQGMPGVAMVVGRTGLWQRLANAPARSVYLHLPTYHARQQARDTPFTPPLQVLMALRQALVELVEETVAARIERYRSYAQRFRAGFVELGLTLPVPEPLRSNTITLINLPAGVGYEKIHAGLKRDGYIIYAGQGELRKTMFRVANMGQLTPADIDGCLAALKRAL